MGNMLNVFSSLPRDRQARIALIGGCLSDGGPITFLINSFSGKDEICFVHENRKPMNDVSAAMLLGITWIGGFPLNAGAAKQPNFGLSPQNPVVCGSHESVISYLRHLVGSSPIDFISYQGTTFNRTHACFVDEWLVVSRDSTINIYCTAYQKINVLSLFGGDDVHFDAVGFNSSKQANNRVIIDNAFTYNSPRIVARVNCHSWFFAVNSDTIDQLYTGNILAGSIQQTAPMTESLICERLALHFLSYAPLLTFSIIPSEPSPHSMAQTDTRAKINDQPLVTDETFHADVAAEESIRLLRTALASEEGNSSYTHASPVVQRPSSPAPSVNSEQRVQPNSNSVSPQKSIGKTNSSMFSLLFGNTTIGRLQFACIAFSITALYLRFCVLISSLVRYNGASPLLSGVGILTMLAFLYFTIWAAGRRGLDTIKRGHEVLGLSVLAVSVLLGIGCLWLFLVGRHKESARPRCNATWQTSVGLAAISLTIDIIIWSLTRD